MSRWRRLWRFPILVSLVLNFILITLVGRLHVARLVPQRCSGTAGRSGTAGHGQTRAMNGSQMVYRSSVEQKLTDLVMPFHEGQVLRVGNNLQSWTTFPPCKPPVTGKQGDVRRYGSSRSTVFGSANEFYSAVGGGLGRNVTLTFALSGVYNATVDRMLKRMFEDLPASVKDCFQGAQVYFANFQDNADQYMEATRNLFSQFLHRLMPLKNSYYALYMEPDMVPVRKYWLSALDATTRHPSPPFWVRGSSYRGAVASVLQSLHNGMHINGNAVYNLRDPAFAAYYSHQVPKTHDAYDVDMIKPLLDLERYNQTGRLIHKFQYTGLIANLWHSNYSLSEMLTIYPELYLIHGGSPNLGAVK